DDARLGQHAPVLELERRDLARRIDALVGVAAEAARRLDAGDVEALGVDLQAAARGKGRQGDVVELHGGPPGGWRPRILPRAACWKSSTLVSAEPTPSARAASIALHTDGKIEPPVVSYWLKAKSSSG